MRKKLYLLVNQSPRKVFYVREYVGDYSHGIFRTKDDDGNDIFFEEDELAFLCDSPEECIRKFRGQLKRNTTTAKAVLKSSIAQEKKLKDWTKKGFKIELVRNT